MGGHSSPLLALHGVGGHSYPLLALHAPHDTCLAFPPPPGAAPGYQPAIVTAFYAPYLLVPLLLALHMAASPRPFGARVPGAGGKPKRK